MNHSSARPTHEYQPTLIENRFLISRLAIQLVFLQKELKRKWTEFTTNPVDFAAQACRDLFQVLRKLFATPKTMVAVTTALLAVTGIVIMAMVLERTSPRVEPKPEDAPLEAVLLDIPPPANLVIDRGRGNAVGAPARPSGGGGDHNPLPPSFGKLPPPSVIPAPIPTTPPINPTTLPVAGINIDPANWTDVKARVYGDPNSKSQTPSNGPGSGGGIGNGIGPGIGNGFSSGGPGCAAPSNIKGSDMSGCTGQGIGRSGPLRAGEVDQRARLLFKPEPQYTEEARRNQVTGTVMLRVVFSSDGEVDQIRAVRTLPFGLTERAIAAARQIKFIPATKDGHPVSVQMQLEYNFNLY